MKKTFVLKFISRNDIRRTNRNAITTLNRGLKLVTARRSPNSGIGFIS